MPAKNPFMTQNVPLPFTSQQKEQVGNALNQSQDIYQNIMKPPIDVGPEAQIQQMLKEYREQAVPGIAERFTGLSPSAQRSNAFPQIMGEQAGNMVAKIDALRSKMGLEQRAQDINRRGQDINLFSHLNQLGMTPLQQQYTMKTPMSKGDQLFSWGIEKGVPLLTRIGFALATGGASEALPAAKKGWDAFLKWFRGETEKGNNPLAKLNEQQQDYLQQLIGGEEIAGPNINQSNLALQGMLRR